jgi:hypothetical protein
MKILLVAIGAGLATSIVLVPFVQSDAQAPSHDENAPRERQVEATNVSNVQPAADARVEISTEPVQPPNSLAEPEAQQYVKFAELHPTVQIFLKQAGKAHYKMKASEFDSLEFDPKSVEPYTAQVEQLAAELKTASEIYDQEVERATELALQSGKYKDFPDETAFMKAVEATEKSAEKPFVISLQGETEGPSGEPRPCSSSCP